MKRGQATSEARVPQTDAASLYDGLARYYDIWARLTESRARKKALRLAAIKDGEAVLEVAVGTGLAFLDAVKRNPSGRNVGIDLSPGMLQKARRRLENAGLGNWDLSVGSAFDIKEPPESFDLLLNSYMFDLIAEEDWPTILGEFRRVLRPAGRLVLTNMTRGEKFGSGVYDRIYRISPRTLGGCRGVRLQPSLEANGFAVHSREYVQQMLFPSEVIVAVRPAT